MYDDKSGGRVLGTSMGIVLASELVGVHARGDGWVKRYETYEGLYRLAGNKSDKQECQSTGIDNSIGCQGEYNGFRAFLSYDRTISIYEK